MSSHSPARPNKPPPKPQQGAAPAAKPAAPQQAKVAPRERAPRGTPRPAAPVGPPVTQRRFAPPVPAISSERPLIEAIFELRWSLALAPDGRSAVDPGYDMLLGRVSDRLRADFPRLVHLPTAALPQASAPFRARHQLRPAGSADWPLLQLGPGVLTLNDSSAYQWLKFEAHASRAASEVCSAYPREVHAFAPTALALRYVNALPLDREELPLVAYLRERLHTSLSVDPALFDDPDAAEKPAGLQFSLTYPLPGIAGAGSVSFASGAVAGRRSLLWTLEAAVSGERAPAQPAGIAAWTRAAHATLSRWFKTLSRGNLASAFPGLAQ